MASNSTMQLEIVSAEGALYSGVVHEVHVPAEQGEIGVHPRHVQLITRMVPGEVRLLPEGEKEFEHLYVSGGMLEILPDVVTILADTGARAADLDEKEALKAKEAAEALLKDADSDYDAKKAKAELLAAAAQLRMLEKIRKKR